MPAPSACRHGEASGQQDASTDAIAVEITSVVEATLEELQLVPQFAHVFQTRGLCIVPAGRAMAIGYTQILFAAVWGALLFAEFPGGLGVIGALLIIGGTLNLTARAWSTSLAFSGK